jgi:hypothetical protein
MKGRCILLLLAMSLAVRAADEPLVVVVPNADGVLDLAGAVQAQIADATPNPFRVRYHPELPNAELPLAISAVLIGRSPAEPSAIVNGQLCSGGDLIQGLKITAITADMLELRQGNILLRVPIRDQVPRLRLPP